jgi:transcription initiation factor TFIIB
MSNTEQFCPKCGLVVNETIFDLNEPNSSSFAIKEELSTIVDNTQKTKDSTGRVFNFTQRKLAKKLRSWQKRMRVTSSSEKNLVVANLEIEKIGSTLSLSSFLKYSISQLYQDLQKVELTKGRSVALTICALTYIVIMQQQLAISFDEVVQAADFKKKKVSRVYKLYMKHIGDRVQLPETKQFITKYILYTDIDVKQRRKVFNCAQKVLDLTSVVAKTGKGPSAYVGALIYLVIYAMDVEFNEKEYIKRAKITTITLLTKLKLILDYLLTKIEPQLYPPEITTEKLIWFKNRIKN